MPVGDERFRAGDPLLLKRPDGSELRTRIGSLEVLDPHPTHQVVVLLKELGKEDVPLGTEVWSVADETPPREVCPCCDYVTLSERGSYDICPVCFWEDDGQDVDQLDVFSGPNHMTLRQGRANFAKFGACEEKMLPNVCSVEERSKFQRRPRSVG